MMRVPSSDDLAAAMIAVGVGGFDRGDGEQGDEQSTEQQGEERRKTRHGWTGAGWTGWLVNRLELLGYRNGA